MSIIIFNLIEGFVQWGSRAACPIQFRRRHVRQPDGLALWRACQYSLVQFSVPFANRELPSLPHDRLTTHPYQRGRGVGRGRGDGTIRGCGKPNLPTRVLQRELVVT